MKKQTLIFILLGVVLTAIVSCGSPETTSSKENDTQVEEQMNSEAVINDEAESEVEKVSGFKWLVPKGYVLFDSIQGDLNGDGIADQVAIIKATDPKKWEMNQFEEKVDKNRRGIVIAMSEGVKSKIVTENLSCFSSENEDGGVYFPPELSCEIEKGKLYIHYAHGRYGYWRYTFRYQDGNIKLIGYDSSENHGPIAAYIHSCNFLTRRKQVKENINIGNENFEDEVFRETWSDLPKKELITLSSIKDFDGLSF